jgi:hypothetical protein
MGRIKPKIVSDLMNIANRFADGEDACNNKQTGLMRHGIDVNHRPVGNPKRKV